MNYRFFLVFCCAQLLNAVEHTANQLPERRNAQGPQLSLLSEEAPARFDGQDPEPRQLSPRDRLDLRYAVEALQLAEGGRSQSPVNQKSEYDNAQKKVSMSTITQSIKDLQKAVGAKHTSYHVLLPDDRNDREILVAVQPVGGPLGFAHVSKPGSSNDQNEEDQDCCKEVAATCDQMATIVGYLTMCFGGIFLADGLMQQIQKNHAKIE